MSATEDLNSEKWSSGAYTIGKTMSPLFRPADTAQLSHWALLVSTAAWFCPVVILSGRKEVSGTGEGRGGEKHGRGRSYKMVYESEVV